MKKFTKNVVDENEKIIGSFSFKNIFSTILKSQYISENTKHLHWNMRLKKNWQYWMKYLSYISNLIKKKTKNSMNLKNTNKKLMCSLKMEQNWKKIIFDYKNIIN